MDNGLARVENKNNQSRDASPVNWIVFAGSYKMSSKINVASAGDQAEQEIRPIC